MLIDHLRGMRRAMEYLLALGHHRIALFVSSAGLRLGREKLAGYKASLETASIAFDERLIYIPASWIESSIAHMAAMLALDAPPTAIIALGTRMLSGAVHGAHEVCLSVPQDLSVIGVGEASTLELMYPPLTMLRYNYERSAQLTVQLMLERLDG